MSNPVTSVPIAIVGMACLFPKAGGLTPYWHVLRAGLDCITDVPDTHWKVDDYHDSDPKSPDRTYCRRGGFLSPTAFDPTEFSLPPSALEATDTSQILGLVVAKAALEDAGYGAQRVFNRERTSVVLGVTGCLELVIPLGARLGHPVWRRALKECGVSDAVAEQVVERISDAYVPWQENSFPGLLGNVVAGRIANRLNLKGTNCVVDAACASSHAAAHLGVMELATGRTDMVVAGGVDTFNDIFMYMCFSKTPALSPSGEIRPFSEQADGTLLGEGIGVVVLKRLDDARRDGDRVYAVVRGVGTSSDGEGSAIYAPSSEGQKRALVNAYQVSGVEPRTVELLEAHGTGTKVGDVVEFEALREVYGGSSADRRWCALGTVKSQIGHTKAAAGAAGLIKTALALHHKVLPPTLKVGAPNPRLDIGTSPFYFDAQARPWFSSPGHPRRAALSSFGFGGSNYHIVLEEAEPEREGVAWDGSVDILAFSAATPETLDAAVAEALRQAEAAATPDAWARIAADTRATFSESGAHRLVAVVDAGAGDDPRQVLAEALRQLRGEGKPRPGAPAIHRGQGPAPGRVAFLFSGQGSQYLGMGRELACVFPEMLAAFESASAATPAGELSPAHAVFPRPALSGEEEAEQKQALTRTDRAQPSLGAVEVGYLGILERFGLAPDLVGGHSYGELPALYAAGRLDLSEMQMLSRLRGRLMAAASDAQGGTMLAVASSWDVVGKVLGDAGVDVTLANRNSPAQTVLSGSHEAIEQAREACRQAGLGVQLLRVSAAFHSPLMADARPPFGETLAGVAFPAGRVPVYANVTGRPYPDEAGASRELLADQLIRPVDFVGQVEHMFESGARLFVEVGPRSVLSGLVRAILGERGAIAIPLDASQGRGSGLADLARALAQCAALGFGVRLSAWEAAPVPSRKKKMEVTLVGANYRSPRPEKPKPSNPLPAPDPAPRAGAPEGAVPTPSSVQASAGPVASPASAPVGASGASRPGVPVELLHEAFQSVQGSLAAMASLQQQTASIHQRFLEGQEAAQRTFHQALEGQQRLVETMLGLRPATAEAAPWTAPRLAPPAVAPTVAVPAPPVMPARPVQGVSIPMPVVAPASAVAGPVRPEPPVAAPAPSPMPAVATDRTRDVILGVVAEKTGYPVEMLDLDMELEADLGIDSIKRVEILAAVEEQLPGAGHVETDRLGTLRTLRQVMEMLSPVAPEAAAPVTVVAAEPTSAPAPAGSPGLAAAEEALLEVVAEKTGYPREMLDLDMELEADLGIDSIKRVEILAALEERLPQGSHVGTDRVGSLRTLRQVIEAMGGSPTPEPPTPGGGAPPPRGSNGVAAAALGTAAVAAALGPPVAEPAFSGPPLERRVLRAFEEDAVPGVFCIAPGHEVRVTDDGTGLADAIVAALADEGVTARRVPLDRADEAAGAPLGGLVIVAPPTLDEAQGGLFLKRAFEAVGRTASGLRGAAAAGGALLCTVARMDGRFGLGGVDFEPLQGGLAGLPKTLAQEAPDVRCRALDVSRAWTDGEAAARAIVAELGASGPLEVGFDGSRRRVVRATPEAAVPASTARIGKGDVVLVTGGARGVTAAVAVALARRTHATLVLMGRSEVPKASPAWLEGLETEADIKRHLLRHGFNGKAPKPADVEREYRKLMANREIFGTLARIEATGARAAYVALDVRDEAAVREAVAGIRSTLGPIRGLIHGAGVLADRRLEDKTREQFDGVFDTKVTGLSNLLRVLGPDDLRALVLFSSVTARFGRPGQVDYCMANEVLNKTAQRESVLRPRCRVVSVNWGPWDGGMVNDGLRKEFARLGVGLIPLEAGARALVAEIDHGAPDVEVMVGDGLPEAGTAGLGSPAPAPAIARRSDLAQILEMDVSLESHPVLASHCLAGRPVVPMALIVEWMGHAALHANPGLRFFGIDDLRVIKGVSLDQPSVHVRFFASPARPGTPDGLRVDVEIRGAQDTSVHARGTVVLVNRLPAAPENGRAHPHPDRAYPRAVPAVYEGLLFHGPHFYAFKSIEGVGASGMTADLKAAPRPQEWVRKPLRTDWLGDPLALDGGLQMGLLWCFEQMGEPSLPMAGLRYRQYRRFPRRGVKALLEVQSNGSRRFTGNLSFLEGDALVASCEGIEFVADSSLDKAFGRRESTKV